MVMTKSSASSEERMSTWRCLYDSVHFNSRERMFAASDFSCAAKGTANLMSRQKVKTETERMCIASMSHSLACRRKTFFWGRRHDGRGKPLARCEASELLRPFLC